MRSLRTCVDEPNLNRPNQMRNQFISQGCITSRYMVSFTHGIQVDFSFDLRGGMHLQVNSEAKGFTFVSKPAIRPELFESGYAHPQCICITCTYMLSMYLKH